MAFRDTKEDMVVEDSVSGSKLEIQEVVLESCGSKAINLKMSELGADGSQIELVLSQDNVQSLMEKLNMWVRTN